MRWDFVFRGPEPGPWTMDDKPEDGWFSIHESVNDLQLVKRETALKLIC